MRVPPVRPRVLRHPLLIATMLHLGLRLSLVVGRRGPINFADETGYLVNARVLAGGAGAALQPAAFYRGGYSGLLLPAMWFGDTPAERYRLVLVTNALLSALVIPLLYLLLRALEVPKSPALAAAAVAGLYPPLVVTTQMGWSEPLLPLAAISLVLAMTHLYRANRPKLCGGAVGVLGAYLWAIHARTAPIVAVTALILMVSAVRMRELRAPVAIALACAGVGWILGNELNDYLFTASWHGQTAASDMQRVVKNALDPQSVESVVALGAGQFWYFVVGSFGLFVVGMVEAATHVRRGLRARRVTPEAVACAVALAGTIGIVLLVGLFLRPPSRPDHVVYGRYAEIFAPLLIALGITRILRADLRAVRRELGIIFGAGAVSVSLFAWYAGSLVSRKPVNWLTVLALPALAQPPHQILPVTATAAGATGAFVVVYLMRRSQRLALVAVGAAMTLSAVAVRVVLIEARDDATWATSTPGALRDVPGLADATTVAYDMATYNAVGLYSYQWELDRAQFILFDSRVDTPPATTWLIAGMEADTPGTQGAERVWVHTESGQAVWKDKTP